MSPYLSSKLFQVLTQNTNGLIEHNSLIAPKLSFHDWILDLISSKADETILRRLRETSRGASKQ